MYAKVFNEQRPKCSRMLNGDRMQPSPVAHEWCPLLPSAILGVVVT